MKPKHDENPNAPCPTDRPSQTADWGPKGHSIPGNPSPADPAMTYDVPDCGNTHGFIWDLEKKK